jgi:hypothetical protein
MLIVSGEGHETLCIVTFSWLSFSGTSCVVSFIPGELFSSTTSKEESFSIILGRKTSSVAKGGLASSDYISWMFKSCCTFINPDTNTTSTIVANPIRM